ncbi:MAG: bifunctional nuclease family protein [Muribaculaceae bacterium]|nr:bifunctional nuclease family protein [Muribaculaceae bacterium]
MKKRHRLKLIGITYNQIESGVYAVILEEVNGDRRIPIVIGYAEAQAIECKLQEVKTPRPLTHDLMKSILDNFNLRLSAVEIYKMPNGVFAANLIIEDSEGDLRMIDSRSSDALALAIRAGAPIYTSSEVLEEAGFRPKSNKAIKENEEKSREEILLSGIDSLAVAPTIESFDNLEEIITNDNLNPDSADAEILEFLANFSDVEIERQIADFAAAEKYEVAARLKALLKKRREQ